MDKINSSQETLYFSNVTGQVIYHPAGYIGINWFISPLAGASFREVLEHVLVLLKQKGLHKIYSDHRGMPPVWIDECAWLLHDWFPRLAREIQYGYCALVQDRATIGSAVLHLTLARIDTLPLNVSCFEASEEALLWLKEV
ncbi:hypothetical protein [Hymenobacter sp. GOD-10R]|uniref:hypothetical protein n=1 Tax=Hymenobacter sp. GOD-10R TaxID=3093922 RepID=UPI002D769B99|nr:hypothetical protein [Hymenobacter sp. GOD-10R]WRQ31588.1 hypothetical protein SD425_28235 [Hymenobacter sp. GOD-10R]